MPTQRALLSLLHPLLYAASMVYVAARELHNQFVLFESLNTDRTCLGTFLHNQRLHAIGTRLLGLSPKTR